MRANNKKSTKRYLAALALLCSGIVVGALGMQYWMMSHGPGFPPPPGKFHKMIFQHFVDEIQLTPEQVRKIEPEFEKSWQEGDKIRQEFEPKIRAIFDAAEDRIRVYLTPEQKVLLQEFHARLEQRRRDRGDGPPPPPFDMPPPRQ